jgi:hypothetical protein
MSSNTLVKKSFEWRAWYPNRLDFVRSNSCILQKFQDKINEDMFRFHIEGPSTLKNIYGHYEKRYKDGFYMFVKRFEPEYKLKPTTTTIKNELLERLSELKKYEYIRENMPKKYQYFNDIKQVDCILGIMDNFEPYFNNELPSMIEIIKNPQILLNYIIDEDKEYK